MFCCRVLGKSGIAIITLILADEWRVRVSEATGVVYRLDAVVDAHAVTQKVLEVMPACCKPVQQSIVDLLPELVPEEDSEVSALLHQLFTAHASQTTCDHCQCCPAQPTVHSTFFTTQHLITVNAALS